MTWGTWGKQLSKKEMIDCYKKIGLTDDCSKIWMWNTVNTKKYNHKGGCFEWCILNHIFNTPINKKYGIFNPCKSCKNTINGKPSCRKSHYKGPYRYNACLQCDECRSGPIFKKYPNPNIGNKESIKKLAIKLSNNIENIHL